MTQLSSLGDVYYRLYLENICINNVQLVVVLTNIGDDDGTQSVPVIPT